MSTTGDVLELPGVVLCLLVFVLGALLTCVLYRSDLGMISPEFCPVRICLLNVFLKLGVTTSPQT